MPLTKLSHLATSNLDTISGGITIGYSEDFATQWMRGWIERCRLYSIDATPTYP